jgi:hypothetical protein
MSFFSNAALGRPCAPGDEAKLADGMPHMGIMETWPVCENIPEAKLTYPDLITKLAEMTHTQRMEFVERVIVRHTSEFPEDGKYTYLTTPTA